GLARRRDHDALDRSRRRARRVQTHASARLSAAFVRAGHHRHLLAPSVRTPSSPAHRRAAPHQCRAVDRRDQGARQGTSAMKRMIIVLGGMVIAAGLILLLMTYHANEDVELPGYMEADLVLVGSEQGGRIAELSVEEGTSVKQGDPIFVLESSEQEASVAAAPSRVHEAQGPVAV